MRAGMNGADEQQELLIRACPLVLAAFVGRAALPERGSSVTSLLCCEQMIKDYVRSSCSILKPNRLCMPRVCHAAFDSSGWLVS